MNRKLRWISLAVILMAICHGAETMAYRFAGEPVVSPPVAECPLLKEAPAPTPFVAAGDVLHDLTGAFREKKVLLDNGWAIWNQTQRLLVVHGVMLDQWLVEELSGFRKQTRHAKLTVDWIRSEKPEDPLAENTPVFASLVLLGRSAMKSNASTKMMDPSGEWSFCVGAEPTILDRCGINTTLSLGWKGPDRTSSVNGGISVSLVIEDGSTLPVASWFVAGHGPAWRITATADTVLSDGSKYRDGRLRQDGEKISITRSTTRTSEWLPICQTLPQNGRNPLAKTLPSEVIREFAAVPEEPNAGTDPFAEKPESSPTPLRDLPDAVIPDHLKDCLTKPLFDLRVLLHDAGVVLEPGDFVAYDPIAERLVMDCKSDRIADMIVALFQTINCGSAPENIECSAWLANAAMPESPIMRVSLLTRSGMKAPFKLLDEKNQAIVSFDAEPTLGDQIPILDFRYNLICRLQSPANLEWCRESVLTVVDNIPVLMDTAKLPDGRTLKQGLRARVMRENPPISR